MIKLFFKYLLILIGIITGLSIFVAGVLLSIAYAVRLIGVNLSSNSLWCVLCLIAIIVCAFQLAKNEYDKRQKIEDDKMRRGIK